MSTHAILSGERAIRCPSCNGTGEARVPWRASDGLGHIWRETVCKWCLGDGQITPSILRLYLRRYPRGEPEARPRQLALSGVTK